jgi:hypothetical protein
MVAEPALDRGPPGSSIKVSGSYKLPFGNILCHITTYGIMLPK